ncbi:Protein fork head [Amphibalanus amphitrite]|uniref:Protein fork head n=1 Tax=Amphibalanus amphitrite TaxID=1232801 RepID=A0A6A4WX89_AMPAM|nr:Protein fork head [Amphibalanus amphitrite]
MRNRYVRQLVIRCSVKAALDGGAAMDPLPMWSTADSEMGSPAAGEHDHTELDNISPSLIVSSLSDIHANYLLDDLNLPDDYPLDECGGARTGTLALDFVPPTPAMERQHSHGQYPCTFSAEECPLNPFSEDPVFGDDPLLMTPETAVTLRSAAAAARPRASSPDTPSRPVGRRPLRCVTKPAAGGDSYREPPPYPGLTQQERTDHTAFYSVSPARRGLGLADRSVPRLKVVRRVTSPAVTRHTGVTYAAPSPPPAPTSAPAAPRRQGRQQSQQSTTGQTDSKHTKPSLSYVNLITLALLNSETGSLRCNEIYDFLQRMFPYFREVSSKTWKNDTRHALSSNQSSSNFCKAPECKDTSELYGELLRGMAFYSGLEPGSPCDQSPTVGSTTDSPDEA